MKEAIVEISGGLGNQMFQYAFGYSISKHYNCKVVLDLYMYDNNLTRGYELNKFNIINNDSITYKYEKGFINRALINKIRKVKSIGLLTKRNKEHKEYTYDESVYFMKDKKVHFSGYWQSEKYFRKYKNEIYEMFTLKDPISQSCEEILNNINKENSVAIHIRRGDYIEIGCNLDVEYFQDAIKYIENNIENPVFYVFSDDIEWVKDKFDNTNKYKFISNSKNLTMIEEFYLMSSCKNQIISNSSFSWWAAWLNKNDDKLVIVPKFSVWSGDFYPDEWIKIKV